MTIREKIKVQELALEMVLLTVDGKGDRTKDEIRHDVNKLDRSAQAAYSRALNYYVRQER